MAAQGALTLSMERRFAVSRTRLFRALTRPGELRRWWGPWGFDVPAIAIDARPGGRYRIAMRPPEGEVFHVTGQYLEVVPPARLAFTFRWEEPDPDDRETVVTISLAESGDSTTLGVAQGPFATEARRELHRDGWSQSLDRLAEALASAA